MRILLANKYHYLKGGADTVFFNTKKLLEDKGHKVIPFCVKDEKNLESEYSRYFVDAPEIRTLNMMEKLKSIRRFIWSDDAARKLEQLIEKEKPDVAHLHNIFNGISLSILPVLKKHNIPVVMTLHDTRLVCPSSYFNLRGKTCLQCYKNGGLSCGWYRCYQDSFVNSWMCAMEMLHKQKLFHYDDFIDKYIFVSNRYLETHAQRNDCFRKKGEVLYNMFPELDKVKGNRRKGDYLLYYGRVTKEKGIITLMEAMKTLPDIKLKIAGTGPLTQELQSWKLNNVEFLGFKSGQVLFDLVENSSFVVVPSEWEENNPMTVIEAYSYGKPVIGARIGGIPEIIVDGETGYIFDAFDCEQLKKVIRQGISVNEEQYSKMSDEARRFAEKHFSPEKHYKELINIYKQVMI